MDIIVLLFVGLCLGSFSNVCIYRWPRGLSCSTPVRSFCPWCESPISWYDNLPVVSALVLKFKCRRCAGRISWRYPIVELAYPVLLMGLLFALPGRYLPVSWIFLVLIGVFCFVVLVTTMTDLDWKIVPDQASFLLIGAALAGSPWNVVLGSLPYERMASALIGLAVGGGGAWLLSSVGQAIMNKDVLGFGDVKLLAGFGALVGWQGAAEILILGALLGAVPATMGLLLGTLRRHQTIPFGPFLNAAAYLVFVLKLRSVDVFKILF